MTGAPGTERARGARRGLRRRPTWQRPSLVDVATATAAARQPSRPVAAKPASERGRSRRPPLVCGLDETERARGVLRVAAGLAERLGARLVLVHAVPDTAIPGASAVPGFMDELRTIETERGHRLLSELTEAEPPGVLTDRRVTFGSPAATLSAVARREDAALIVVGCGGRGALAAALLGSVSAELARSARCPVVVVPSHAARTPASLDPVAAA